MTIAAPEDEAQRHLDELRRLDECVREPIRTPGRIQSHGRLVAVDPRDLIVRVASEDVAHWLGRPLGDVAGDVAAAAARRADSVDPVRASVEGEEFDVIAHPGRELVLVEFEPVIPGVEYSRTAVVGALRRLSAHTDADELRAAAAREVRAATGFDRVMIYHFHDDGHGEVVAEERVEELEPYLGLHFPASDIPAQARELYVSKISRAIVSTEDAGTPLVAADRDAAGVDLSLAELRSVSPYHLQFMRNMGQRSTVSFSLVRDGRLVGMITCAHRTERRLPVLLRRALEVLADQVSRQLGAIAEIARLREAVESRERRAALLAPLFASDDIPAALLGGSRTVLDLVPADGFALRLDGRVSTAGTVPPVERIEEVLAVLGDENFVSESLPRDRPDLAARLPFVAGLIVVPLGTPGDSLVFVRHETTRTMSWLGDPSPANRATPLSPRSSFSAWQESVVDTAEPWGPHHREAVELGRELRGALERRAEAHLARLALRDPLTGLHNRRHLDERLESALLPDRLERGVAVLFVDLDDFKLVNDGHGHDVGDEVLVEVARRLTVSSRRDDSIVRLGGDEFVIVCEDVDAADARQVAERIVAAVARPMRVREVEVRVSISCGVALAGPAATASELLDAADAAMYRAKAAGRNRVSD